MKETDLKFAVMHVDLFLVTLYRFWSFEEQSMCPFQGFLLRT